MIQKVFAVLLEGTAATRVPNPSIDNSGKNLDTAVCSNIADLPINAHFSKKIIVNQVAGGKARARIGEA